MAEPRFQITLPLPAPELSPNYRARHWSVVANAKAQYRGHCKAVAVNAKNLALRTDRSKPPPWPTPPAFPLKSPVTMHLTFVYPDRRSLPDPDNAVAAFKAGLDGIVDAGVLVDDSSEHLRIGEPVLVVERGVPQGGEVRVVLE